MKRSPALLITALLLMTGAVIVSECSDGAGETTVTGYLHSESKDISTVSGIYIAVVYWDGDIATKGEVLGSAEQVAGLGTGGNRFTVTIVPKADLTGSHYYLYISIPGLSIGSWPTSYISNTPTEIEFENGEKWKCYPFKTASITSGGVNSLGSSTEYFDMKSAMGTVTGNVTIESQETIFLNGAKVYLYDLETEKELTKTVTYTSSGKYTIRYDTGTYGIAVEISGYDTVRGTVTINEGETTAFDAQMKSNTSFFGLDLSHVLMIIGGIVGLVLILFATFYRLHLK